MKRLGKLLTMTFAVFYIASVSNATDITIYKSDEPRAVAIQFAIAEGIRVSKANEDARVKLDETRVEAIQAAVAEAIRLTHYCGSADTRNCVHSK